MTVTSTKIDSSHESGKNFITWAWPASTTIIYKGYYSLLCTGMKAITKPIIFGAVIEIRIRVLKQTSAIYFFQGWHS
jgi:hypothetical protein